MVEEAAAGSAPVYNEYTTESKGKFGVNAGVPVVVVAVVVLLPVSHSRGDGGYSRTTDSDDRARVQNITKRDGGDLQKKNAFCTSRTHDDMYTRARVFP